MAESLTQHFLATTLLIIIFLTITISHFHFAFSSEDSKPTGFTLSLIPGDSPDSPLYQGNLTRHERMQRLIEISQAKAALYRLKSTSPAKATTTLGPKNVHLPIIRNTNYYAVKVGIGNPVYNTYLLFDTGSGLIWTQCEPCESCYPMESGIYDPSHSSTYALLPCTHPLCQSGHYDCFENRCVYVWKYGDGAGKPSKELPKTQGFASSERFTFATQEGGSSDIDGMVFGCSHYVQNFQHLMFNGKISGMLGMSLAPDSFVAQLLDRIDRKFSYCIPSSFGELVRPIFVSFGTDVPRISEPLENTLFVLSSSDSEHYFLDLRDVSVGTQRLGFPKDTFKVSEDGSEGFIIDSGAPFTLLAENSNGVNAYLSVMNAFDGHYHESHGLPKAQDGAFEYCYALPNDFDDFLTMTFHFYPRAEFVVHSRDMHYFNVEMGYFCVALLKGSGLSILGTYQQQNKHIVYNLDLKALQFATVTCPY